ncbi:ABC transporter permease [Aquipuribacter sp. SD81]|uniref:ABC transporter permease n=1 Tax=Aquipuribacter sp. SD81 TaxID=3127703 RepID=UPI003019E3E8
MRGVAVARLLRAPGRAVACVLALTLAVGFAVLVQLVGTEVERVVREADTASVAGADVAVRVDWTRPGAAALPGRVAAVPGVGSVTRTGTAMHEAALPGVPGTRPVLVLATPPAGDLRWGTLTAGRWPSAPGEVAVTDTATPGQRVGLTRWDVEGPGTAGGEVTLDVVGVVDPGLASDVPVTGLFLSPEQALDLGAGTGELLVAGTADTAAPALLEAVAPLAAEAGGEAVDADEVRAERMRSSATLVLVLQTGVGAFAALAVLVAVVVVANTWSVLLAQRVREQALLRCVGATRRDLWRSGLLEAALTGVVGGTAGLVVGWAGAVAARAVATPYLPAGVPVPVPDALTVALALGLGVVASLVAAAAPLLRARDVSPLVALRPVEAVPDTLRVSRVRRAVGVLLVLAGAVGVVVGAGTGTGSERVLVAMPSAFVSFVGVLVLATAVLPRVAAVLASALRALGPAGDLAAASAGRNPRRTAATGSAVLIGVTLAVTAAVGAASLRATSTAVVGGYVPVDVTVTVADLSPAARDALVRDVREVAGVSGAVAAAQVEVVVERTGAAADDAVTSYGTTAWAGALEAVVPASDTAPGPGAVVLSAPVAEELGVATGDTVRVGTGEVTGVEGAAGGGATATAVVVVDTDTPLPVLLPTDALGAGGPVPTLALALEEGLSRGQVVAATDAVTAAALAADPAAGVDAPVLLVGSVQRTFDTLLAVVVGLLAVTVLIALVGVSNTVSLSLVERRQEHALLRALGLSRARLRRVVALEALVLGAVGAVVGTVLGVGYGVAGTYALVAGAEEVVVAVPWLWLVAVPAGVGAVAVLASLWPAHRASAVAPAAALAPAV